MDRSLTRRNLLSSSAVLLGAVALTACGAQPTPGPAPQPMPPPGTVPTWVTVLQTIGATVKQDEPQLAALGLNLSQTIGGTGLTVDGILTDIEHVASGIGAASSLPQGQSALRTIEGYINVVAPVIAPIAAAVPGYGTAISLAIAALPLAEAALNAGVSLLSPQAQALAATAAPRAAMVPGRVGATPSAPMSPEQALVLLEQRRR